MKKHIQTILYDPDPEAPRGNCWQTVLACMLDLEIEDVPHFVDIDDKGGPDWWKSSVEWIWDQGYEISVHNQYPNTDDYVMVTGKSPRGDFYHVVIYKNGELFHDPHPSGAGILTEESWELISPR